MSHKAFPYDSMLAAWDIFDKVANACFERLLEQEAEVDPEILIRVKAIRNRDYCARLMYILNMFAYEGDEKSEFDLDWAMLWARPLSAKQAAESLTDLVNLGLMTEVTHGIERNISNSSRLTQRKNDIEGTGGYTDTKYDFS